jgi:hypothetical protein
MVAKARSTSPTSAPATPRPEVRQQVRKLLGRSKAFAALSPEKQQQVARDTALIADYLAAPEDIPGNTIPGGVALPQARTLADGDPPPPAQTSYRDARKAVSEIGDDDFEAGAAREGAKVAGQFMKAVNFVDFVGGLIQGVFSSIVDSSIRQMEAYSDMVGQVAKSLQQFRDDNVTENQGRDHMVEKYPDMFEIGDDEWSETPGPRLVLREGVDESAALARVRSSMTLEEGKLTSMDLSDENVEKVLIVAARTQLARQRQQLLASLVLMGINRIVITDGRISAKIMYDFRARDTKRLRRSAVANDFARDAQGNLAVTRQLEGEYDSGSDTSYERERSEDSASVNRDSSYYAKGTYKYSEAPVMTASSTASEASDSELQTRAQLAGAVEVNFKSDYLPLEKMATPGMIAAIQGHSTPVDPNVVPSAKNPPGQAPETPPAPAPTGS